jgi:hypothetical protein
VVRGQRGVVMVVQDELGRDANYQSPLTSEEINLHQDHTHP